MSGDSPWLSMILSRVRPGLEDLCSKLGVLKECSMVLESLVESHPVWFEGKKKRTIIASVIYISLLISNGPKRGVLKNVIDLTGISKVSLGDAVSRLIKVDWELGLVYLDPRLYSALRKRVVTLNHVVPATLSEIIRARLSRVFPGLYESLTALCKKSTGKDCVTLLLEDPIVIRDIIVNKYGSPLIAERVIEKMLAPVIDILGIKKLPRELVDMLFNNPDELRELMISHAHRSKRT